MFPYIQMSNSRSTSLATRVAFLNGIWVLLKNSVLENMFYVKAIQCRPMRNFPAGNLDC